MSRKVRTTQYILKLLFQKSFHFHILNLISLLFEKSILPPCRTDHPRLPTNRCKCWCSCVRSSNLGEVTSNTGEDITLSMVISFRNVIVMKLTLLVFVCFSQKLRCCFSQIYVLIVLTLIGEQFFVTS